MQRFAIACALAAGGFMLATTWPQSVRPLGATAIEWTPPPDDGGCGDDVELVGALPDPDDLPDRLGETVWLRSYEPVAVTLAGWTLASGRSRRELDGVVLAPGERVALVGAALHPVKLGNRGGSLRLVDPCGIHGDLSWPEVAPGETILVANERAPPPFDSVTAR